MMNERKDMINEVVEEMKNEGNVKPFSYYAPEVNLTQPANEMQVEEKEVGNSSESSTNGEILLRNKVSKPIGIVNFTGQPFEIINGNQKVVVPNEGKLSVVEKYVDTYIYAIKRVVASEVIAPSNDVENKIVVIPEEFVIMEKEIGDYFKERGAKGLATIHNGQLVMIRFFKRRESGEG